MRHHARVLSVVIVAVVLLSVACEGRNDVRREVLPEGEIIRVKGNYTLVLLSDQIMRRTFGKQWRQLSLYYSTNRALDERGEPMMITEPLQPLAKGTPVLLISGDDWSDLVVPVYALESREQAVFVIDTVRPKIEVRSPKKHGGRPWIAPDGTLSFP